MSPALLSGRASSTAPVPSQLAAPKGGLRTLQRPQQHPRLVATTAMAPERSFVMPSSAADLQALRARLNSSLGASTTTTTTATTPPPSSKSAPGSKTCSEAAQQNPSLGWRPASHHKSQSELWQAIRLEAQADADAEPSLASFLYSTILGQPNLERSVSFLLANKLASPTMLGTQLMRLIQDAYDDDKGIMEACCADIQAVIDRDPACDKYSQCLLYFKGFQAVQCHRIAHWLWNKGRKALAYALQSRISEVFHVDIHPAAVVGRGVLMDHATGVVIGETATIGDNVSMLHHVTLGGSGTGKGKRHPNIGHGVLLGAGVSVLGPITVGAGSKVGAGSVVVTDLPTHCVAVGVPARIIRQNVVSEPCQDMDQTQDFILDYVI